MAWLYLGIAGCFEVGFSYFIKASNGFKEIIPSLLFFVCSFLSLYFINKAVSSIPISVAYTVWTSIGAMGACLVGILFYGEYVSLLKIALIINMIISVIILIYLK